MCLAVPGEIIEILNEDALPAGRVSFAGVVQRICLACTPDAEPGDYVIAHAGFAITVIDAREARVRLAALGVDEACG